MLAFVDHIARKPTGFCWLHRGRTSLACLLSFLFFYFEPTFVVWEVIFCRNTTKSFDAMN